MKKLSILFLAVVIALAVVTPALAQRTFRDVPPDHWAASAVYDLVKLGVTTGYPDGTFRGSKNITRYETAIMISKLAKIAGAVGMEKLASELREEMRALKAEIARLRRPGAPGVPAAPLSGSYQARYAIANLLTSGTGVAGVTAQRGPLANYRLKTTLAADLGEGASVVVNLDTMDAGFYGGGQALVTQLLDVQGTLSADLGLEAPVNIVVTSGPGPRMLTGNPTIVPSEVGVLFIRPRNAVNLSTSVGGVDLSGGYIVRGTGPLMGKVDVNHFTATVGYGFGQVPMLGDLKVSGTADYITRRPLATPTGPRDIRGKIDVAAAPADNVAVSATLGLGHLKDVHGLYVGGELVLTDYFKTGTDITLVLHKVGTEYLYQENTLDTVDLLPLDVFGRPIGTGGAGVVDLGGEVTQVITDKISLVGKGDLRLSGDYKFAADKPQALLTVEGGVAYDIAPNTVLDAIYRIHHIPSASDKTSDLAAIGLLYTY